VLSHRRDLHRTRPGQDIGHIRKEVKNEIFWMGGIRDNSIGVYFYHWPCLSLDWKNGGQIIHISNQPFAVKNVIINMSLEK